MKRIHKLSTFYFTIIFLSLSLTMLIAKDSASLLWVYLGHTTEDSKFNSIYFESNITKEINTTVQPIRTMSLREGQPKKEYTIWLKADRLSFLYPDMRLRIEDKVDINITDSEDNNITAHWVGGKVLLDTDKKDCNCWYVVVASEPTIEKAIQYKNNFTKANPSIDTSIYLSSNNYYTVVIGSNLSQRKAKEIILDAMKKNIADNPYIWPSKNWKHINK